LQHSCFSQELITNWRLENQGGFCAASGCFFTATIPPFMEYYLAPVSEVAHALHTTPAGLDYATALQRLAEYGPNQLADSKQKAWWQLLLRQFTDVMILVLLAAAGISVAVGEAQLAYVILAIIILNAALGFGQEYRADKAMAALQQLAPQQAQVGTPDHGCCLQTGLGAMP
jgi:magnesium-transporting ATPase (P-type)